MLKDNGAHTDGAIVGNDNRLPRTSDEALRDVSLLGTDRPLRPLMLRAMRNAARGGRGKTSYLVPPCPAKSSGDSAPAQKRCMCPLTGFTGIKP